LRAEALEVLQRREETVGDLVFPSATYAVSKTIGHASVETTARYIHTNFADVMKIAEAVSALVFVR